VTDDRFVAGLHRAPGGYAPGPPGCATSPVVPPDLEVLVPVLRRLTDNVTSVMHQVPLRHLPIEVLGQVGPLLRDAELIVACTTRLSDTLDRYVVAGVSPAETVCICVTRTRLGVTRRSVRRASGEAAIELLAQEGLLPRRRRRPQSLATACSGQLTN
jgi:hypothetical protein